MRTVTFIAGAVVSLASALAQSPSALNIVTTSLPDGAAGIPYSATLAANGGTTPYTWSALGLPAGLALDAVTGTIAGTPAAAGTFPTTVNLQDAANNTATTSLTIRVTSGLTITSTSPLPSGAVRMPYSQALAAISGAPPYSWAISSGSLPTGIRLDSPTGLLSGTPTAAGTFSFTASVTDADSTTVSKPFQLTIVPGLSITTASLPGGTLGAPYSQTVTAVAGTSPYAWGLAAGSLPPGLTLDSASGTIAGTPDTQGTYSFTVQVTDAVSATATKILRISIAAGLTVTTGPSLPPGTLGLAYSEQLTAAGGLAPYTWSVAAGSNLPAGLALDASSGAITGAPSAAGSFQFTAEVTDNAGASATAQLSIDIGVSTIPAVTITAPDTARALDQPNIGLTLARGYPSEIRGQLTLAFSPDAAAPADDPAIQFSTGGRTVDFTIPANGTAAQFSSGSLKLQAGSVAGTITITAKLQAGGADVTPDPAPAHTITIARAAPVIRTLRLVRTSGGFEVWITGYASSREITQAAIHFTAAPGADLRTSDVTIPMTDAARQWFADAGSAAYGSQFTIVQPFAVAGDGAAVASVAVTLTNAVGTSNAMTASF